MLCGCANSPSDDRYINYGQVRAQRVRIPPCNAFYADESMDWASDMNTHAIHDRIARASVDLDGRVRCTSKETANSTYIR